MDFDPTLAPRIGIVKKLSDHTSLHGSISYGFSPPTQWEVQTQAGVNPDLKPESGVNYEVGFRGTLLKQRLNVDVSAYNFNLQDAILPRYNEGQQEYFENAGTTNQNGVEALVSFLAINDPAKPLTLLKPWISYTFNDYKFDDYKKEGFEGGGVVTYDYSGNKLTGIAPNIVNVGMDMETQLGLYMMITLNYVDEIPLDDSNSESTKAYTLAGGKFGYRKRIGNHFKLDAFAGIDNAFGAQYSNFLSLNATNGRYYNPGADTNYFGGLSIKYQL
jgi:iron complex outermembrane receptor protein